MRSSHTLNPAPAVSADLAEEYACGKCMYLAAALHRRFGFEIQAALSPGEPAPFLEHAWVVEPGSGDVVDIDGRYPADRNGWVTPSSEVCSGLDEAGLRDLVRQTAWLPFTDQTWDAGVTEALGVVDRYFCKAAPRAVVRFGFGM